MLIVDDESDLEQVERLIVRTGHSRFAGYLSGGMKAWEMAGLPLEKQEQLTVEELSEIQDSNSQLMILDVRSASEFEAGHIPDAKHYYIGDMRDRIVGLDKSKPIACYCGSGYRASLAASLMKARGFADVRNVTGSWAAWTAKSLPTEEFANAEVTSA